LENRNWHEEIPFAVAIDTTPITESASLVVPEKSPIVRKYSSRFLIAFFLVAFIQVILLLIPPMPDDTAYLAAINDKDELLKDIQGPRILLIGGSNLTFGVDSIYLQKQLGIPVLNQSLCSPIGLRFMLRHVRSQIHAGDIVVISPEYSHFGELQDGGTELSEMLWVFPQGLKYLSLENAAPILQSLTGIFQHKINFWQKFGVRSNGEDSIYRRNGFNGHGDLITHLKVHDYKKVENDFKCQFLSESPEVWAPTVNLLADFKHDCAEHGARVFYAYPPIPASSYDAVAAEKIRKLSALLRERTGIVFLSDPTQSVYPNSAFFMTLYHLAAQARAERTIQLVQELKPVVTRAELNAAAAIHQQFAEDAAGGLGTKALSDVPLDSRSHPHSHSHSHSHSHPDIVSGRYRCGLGAGWYPIEHQGADVFRWVNNDAEIWLPLWHNPEARFTISLQLEPGPSLGTRSCLIKLLDDQDKPICEYSIAARQAIKLKLPERLYGSVIKIHVDSDNRQIMNEPRTLNFRVFDLAITKE
jgi:hypothetical protein